MFGFSVLAKIRGETRWFETHRGPALARALAALALVDAGLVPLVVISSSGQGSLLPVSGGVAALLLAIVVLAIPREWLSGRAWVPILAALLMIFVGQADESGGLASPFAILILLAAIPCAALLPARASVLVVATCVAAYLLPLAYAVPSSLDLRGAASGGLLSLALLAGLYQGIGALRRQEEELKLTTQRLQVVNSVLEAQLAEIQLRERWQRALHRLAALGPGRGDEEAVWHALRDEVQGLFGSDQVDLFTVGSSGALARLTTYKGDTGPAEPEDDAEGDLDPARVAIETRRTQYLATVDSGSPIARRLAQARGVRSAAYIPLLGRERVLGVMALSWRSAENPLPSDDLRLCQTLAQEAATVLEAILMERAEKELKARVEALYEEVRALSLHDALTGLYNRRFFDEVVERDLQHAARAGEPIAVLMADLDRFHDFNERHGHEAGDRALQAFAGALQAIVRGADTSLRWGGDEFLVLLPSADRGAALRVAERIRAATGRLVIGLRDGEGGAARGRKRHARITVSIGFAVFPDDGEQVADLVAAADRALYSAKRAGRDRTASGGQAA